MARSASEHNALVQQAFTKQATAYAANPTIVDSDWAMRLVHAAQPTAESRVLEVATGPGYVALAFATVCREVVAVDLTDAPLTIARQNQTERGLTNVTFESADANRLPFDDGSFDLAVCRLSFHHFDTPGQVLAEMARVCRPGGKVAVEDLIASECADRAAYYDRWERLRDPSHVTALSLGQLIGLYRDAGLEIENLRWEQRRQDVERWLRTTDTPPETAEQVRQLIQADAEQHLSGTPVFRDDDARLCFLHRMVTTVGRKR
ncbi:MAG: class I SAM-dependent methyltransferase [Acidobacteriota bacterium]|nr:class I SAM-dependent methyltransferase [Acidobacteriota bacterium]